MLPKLAEMLPRRKGRASRGLARLGGSRGVESLEGRSLMAHLAIFAPAGAGASAVTSSLAGGPYNDSQIVPLRAADVAIAPPNATLVKLAGTQGGLVYQNAPTHKSLTLSGSVSVSSDALARVDFGTSRSEGPQDLGSLIDVVIEPDPGDAAGQAIDVSLAYVAKELSQVNGSSAGVAPNDFTVLFANAKDGPVVHTLGSGSVVPGSPSTGSVVLHTSVGQKISFGIRGTVAANGAAAGAVIGGVLQVGLEMDLVPATPGTGGPGPVPPPSTTSVVSATGASGIADARGTSAIVVSFNGALDASSAVQISNYELRLARAGRGHRVVLGRLLPVDSATYDAAAHQVTLHLGRPLRPGQVALLTVRGTGVHDSAGHALSGDLTALVRGRRSR